MLKSSMTEASSCYSQGQSCYQTPLRSSLHLILLGFKTQKKCFVFLVIKLTWRDQNWLKICMARSKFGAQAH